MIEMVCDAFLFLHFGDYIYKYIETYLYIYNIYIYISLKTEDNSYKLECAENLITFFSKTFFSLFNRKELYTYIKNISWKNKVAFYYT